MRQHHVNPGREGTITGTFAIAQYADSAAGATRRAGFRAERRSGGVVVVEIGDHSPDAEEICAILAAYGAQEYTRPEIATQRQPHEQRTGETQRIPIIEEEVVVHKRPVVIEEIIVGKRMLQETQTVSDPVRREQARIEPHGDAAIQDR